MVCFEPARLGKDVEAGTARLSKDTGRLGRHCLEPVCPCLPIHLWRTVKGEAAAQRRARDVILIAAVPRGQELWQHRMGQQLQCNRCMWQCRPQRHAMMCFAHRGHELLLLAHCRTAGSVSVRPQPPSTPLASLQVGPVVLKRLGRGQVKCGSGGGGWWRLRCEEDGGSRSLCTCTRELARSLLYLYFNVVASSGPTARPAAKV